MTEIQQLRQQVRELDNRFEKIAGMMPKYAISGSLEGHKHVLSNMLGSINWPLTAGASPNHYIADAGGIPRLYIGAGGTFQTFVSGGLEVRHAVAAAGLRLSDGTDGVNLGVVSTGGTRNVLEIISGALRLSTSTPNNVIQAGASDKIIFQTGGSITIGPTLFPSVPLRLGTNTIQDSVGVTRIQFVPGGNIIFTGTKTGDLQTHGDRTNEMVIRRTTKDFVATITGTGGMLPLELDHTHAADKSYRIEIDGGGALGTATFRWSDSGGGAWNASAISTSIDDVSLHTLQNNILIQFSAGNFVVGDRWDFTAIGTANQIELLRADTRNQRLTIAKSATQSVTFAPATAGHMMELTGGFSTFTSGELAGSTGFTIASSSTETITNGFAHRVLLTAPIGADGITLWGSEVSANNANAGRTGTTIYVGHDQLTASGGTYTLAAGRVITVGTSFTAPILTDLRGLKIQRSPIFGIAAGSGTSIGAEIPNMGHANFANVYGLYIASQTAGGTLTVNLYQQGTTGVNRLAAPTLIGADASPAAGFMLEVREKSRQQNAAAGVLYEGYVAAEANPRIRVQTDRYEWRTGGAATTGMDLRRQSIAALDFVRDASAAPTIRGRIEADTQPRWQLGSGGYAIGPGGATPVDVSLARFAANEWQMGAEDSLEFQPKAADPAVPTLGGQIYAKTLGSGEHVPYWQSNSAVYSLALPFALYDTAGVLRFNASAASFPYVQALEGLAVTIGGAGSGAALGSEVFRLRSPATNDDPQETTHQNRVATTDATVTTLHTYTVPAATTVALMATVTARRTGGAAGTAEDGAHYTIMATVKNVAGTATLVTAGATANPLKLVEHEDQAGWDATIDVTGATARVRVTGAVNNNITWHLSALRVWPVGT